MELKISKSYFFVNQKRIKIQKQKNSGHPHRMAGSLLKSLIIGALLRKCSAFRF